MIAQHNGITFVNNTKEIKTQMDYSFSNKVQIEDSFKNLFKDEKEFVTILSGEWGVGKTYFWEEFVKDNLTKKKNVYISMFGFNSINDIKTYILLEVSPIKKGINWINQKASGVIRNIKSALSIENVNIPLDGALISSVFAMLTQGDFENVILCFDDIERISNKIELKEFMGFLSELKEKNKCQIIVILNENELESLSQIDGKKYNEIFSLYKEKIVDYEFHYKPSIKECFEVVKSKIDYFNKDAISEFFNKRNIKNIRVMTQCVYHLNKFSFIKEYELDKKIEHNFLVSALTAFVFKTVYNLSENKFKKFLEYRKQFDKDKKTNDEFNKYGESFNSGIDYSEVDDILYKYLYNLHIDKVTLRTFLKNKNRDIHFLEIKEKLEKLDNDYKYDLKFTKKKYDSILEKTLDENKEDLFKALNHEDLKTYLDELEKISSNNKEKLKKEILEFYIKNEMNTQDGKRERRKNDVISFLELYPELEEYVNQYRKHYTFEQSTLSDFFASFTFNGNVSLNKKDELILYKNRDEIKKEIINSSEFLKKCVNVILSPNRNGDISCLREIFKELANENEEYRSKIEMIDFRLLDERLK